MKKGFLYISFFLLVGLAQSQTPGFTQYYHAPLLLNPAMTSLQQDIYLGVNYKNTRRGDIPFETEQVAAIYPIITQGASSKHLGGAGLSVMRDRMGEYITRYTASLSGSYNQKLDFYGTQFLIMGAQFGYQQTSIPMSDNIWPSMVSYNGVDFDIAQPGEFMENQQLFTINAGIYYTYNSKNSRFKRPKNFKLYAGASVFNINRPNESLTMTERETAPLILKGQIGGDFDITRNLEASVGGLTMRYGNGQMLYNVGGNLSFKKVVRNNARATSNPIRVFAGGWYRWQDMYTVLLGGEMARATAAFSMDLNATEVNYQGRGQVSYELSVSYRLPRKKNLQKFSTPLF